VPTSFTCQRADTYEVSSDRSVATPAIREPLRLLAIINGHSAE
jgi:hypothetical protein